MVRPVLPVSVNAVAIGWFLSSISRGWWMLIGLFFAYEVFPSFRLYINIAVPLLLILSVWLYIEDLKRCNEVKSKQQSTDFLKDQEVTQEMLDAAKQNSFYRKTDTP